DRDDQDEPRTDGNELGGDRARPGDRDGDREGHGGGHDGRAREPGRPDGGTGAHGWRYGSRLRGVGSSRSTSMFIPSSSSSSRSLSLSSSSLSIAPPGCDCGWRWRSCSSCWRWRCVSRSISLLVSFLFGLSRSGFLLSLFWIGMPLTDSNAWAELMDA